MKKKVNFNRRIGKLNLHYTKGVTWMTELKHLIFTREEAVEEILILLASKLSQHDTELVEKIKAWCDGFEGRYCDWNAPSQWSGKGTPEEVGKEVKKDLLSLITENGKK